MICYRDMTFCEAKCGNLSCNSNFTDKVREEARKWWGGDDVPVAFADLSIGCRDYIPIQDTPHE